MFSIDPKKEIILIISNKIRKLPCQQASLHPSVAYVSSGLHIFTCRGSELDWSEKTGMTPAHSARITSHMCPSGKGQTELIQRDAFV